jgi:CRP/FNR family transcriptional regulator, dissimilatory nitrate respiration regulator
MPVFQGISARNAVTALRALQLIELGRGQVFVRRGEALPGLCGLLSGQLKLCVDTGRAETRIFGLVAAGETFAEAAALRGAPSPFDVIALEEAQVMAIPVPALEQLLARDRHFGRNLLALLAERALSATTELEAGALQRAPQRLASYLSSLAVPGDGAYRITLPVSKTLLAARLGVKKATLSRLLRQLTVQGTIAMEKRDITILDRAALENVSSGPARSA